MASERQIAANRRNARKSSGPRSSVGKKRASRNAYRHGLNLSITSTAAYAKLLDKLVRKITGDTEDAITLERAREIVQAELELARVRQAKVALIKRASAFGELDPPQAFSSVTQIVRLLNSIDRGRVPSFPEPVDSSATMPSQEPDRSAEAIRRVLPELRKLDRYEHRVAARRDRAVLKLFDRKNMSTINSCTLAKRTHFFSIYRMACQLGLANAASFIGRISALKIDGNPVRAGGRQAG
jgi:hypothetical protein